MNKKDKLVIALDFDGTVVTHDYPKVGQDIGAQEVIRQLVAKGYQIILYTMRSGSTLMDAKEWFDNNEIPLYGVNHNPTQLNWTTSPKIYANIYIDDAALGVPLIKDKHKKPYVDWMKVQEWFKKNNLL